MVPDLLGTDQPERRILREPLGIVHIFVFRQPAVNRLPDQVGQSELCVLAPGVSQVRRDEVAESQTFIQLPHQDQATVGGNPPSLEVGLPGSAKGELEGLVWFLTPLAWISGVPSPRSHAQE
jgi:hypothetical protein